MHKSLWVAACVMMSLATSPAVFAEESDSLLSRPPTIIPTIAEVRNIPRAREGRAVRYPGRVLRYGANLHPGARLARTIIFR